MENESIGWIAAIIIGGFAGWIAERVMHSNMGVLMNVLLGIVGAVVANWLLRALHLQLPFGPWVAYLIAAFIGACILIFVGRLIRR